MAKKKLDPNNPKDRLTILQHPTRLVIARACMRRPHTIGQLCKLLAMEDGALRGTVKQLKDWTLLLEVPGPSVRGQLYQTSPLWDRELAQAVRRHRPIDLSLEQRAVLVNANPPADAPLDDVAWIVEFENGRQSLLALADDADAAASVIETHLQQSGLEASVLRVTGSWNPNLEKR